MASKPAVDSSGIPLKTSYPEGVNIPVMYTGFMSVLFGIGGGCTYGIYTMGKTAAYDSKIATLASLGLGWAYSGLLVWKVVSFGININLGVARKESKVNVPDQQVYKQHGEEKKYVLMEQEGVLGRFNRAQRAYQNLLEGATGTLANYLCAAFVFPFESFCLLSVWGICKIGSAIGYTKSADERVGPNMLSMLASAILESMVVFAGVKAILAE